MYYVMATVAYDVSSLSELTKNYIWRKNISSTCLLEMKKYALKAINKNHSLNVQIIDDWLRWKIAEIIKILMNCLIENNRLMRGYFHWISLDFTHEQVLHIPYFTRKRRWRIYFFNCIIILDDVVRRKPKKNTK